MNDNLYCYLRVSSQQQVDEGNSIENQRHTGKKVAKSLGLKYVEMNEGGLSSTRNTRPVLEEIKLGILNGRIKKLWYYSRSRWTRTQLEDALLKKNYFIPNKIKIYEGQNGVQRKFTDPTEKFLDNIITMVQEMENDQRRLVSVAGKRHLSLTQGHTGVFMGGTINFGYMNVEKRWTINPEESEWVKKIFSEYLNGKSLKEVKILLDTNDVRPRRGALWTLGTLNTMLRNKVYIGEYTWVDKENEETYNIVVPSIISHSMFNRVQSEIEKRRKNKGNNTRKYESLLTNLLSCYCGQNISGQVRKSVGKSYYTCSSKRHRWKGKEVAPCDNTRGMNLDATDAFVVSEIKKVVGNSSLLKQKFKTDILKTKNESTRDINKQKKSLEGSIKTTDSQIELTIKTISTNEVNHQLNKVDERVYKQVKELCEIELKSLDERKKNAISEINDLDNRKDWVDWVSKYGNTIKKDFNKVSSELLEGIIKDIRVYPKMGESIRSGKELQVGHELEVIFKLPIVGDGIKYNNPEKKSEGYELVKGKQKLTIQTEIPKGGRGNSVKKKRLISETVTPKSNLSPLNRFGCYPLEEGLIPYIVFSMTLQSNDLIPEQTYNPKQEVLYKLIVQLRSDGLSFIKISKKLNAWGIKTYRGNTWLPQSVHSVLKKKSLREHRIRTQRKKYFPVVISEFKLKYDYA